MKKALALTVALLAVIAFQGVRDALATYRPLPEYKLFFSAEGLTGTNLADSTTYYWGWHGGTGFVTTADPGYRVVSPVTGTVKRVYGLIWVNNVLGSNENVTITLRNITANTEADITTTAQFTANRVPYSSTNLGLAVTLGDELCMKMTTPAWATNPTQVFDWTAVIVK